MHFEQVYLGVPKVHTCQSGGVPAACCLLPAACSIGARSFPWTLPCFVRWLGCPVSCLLPADWPCLIDAICRRYTPPRLRPRHGEVLVIGMGGSTHPGRCT